MSAFGPSRAGDILARVCLDTLGALLCFGGGYAIGTVILALVTWAAA